jgi:6-pyruvoyltetrahydropterin/6-carboxytetrahydropterin synthase
MVYLTRQEHFNAAHKLHNPNWTPEKNEAVFGKCANKNWHGHNYILEVTLKGKPNLDTGYLFDAKELSKIINKQVIDHVDHANLNLDVPFMLGLMCSTEIFAMQIWKQLEPFFTQDVKLHCVKLWETPRIYVSYYGE